MCFDSSLTARKERLSGSRAEATMGTISDKDRQKTVDGTSAANTFLLGAAGITAIFAPPVAIGLLIASAGTTAATITAATLPGDDET